MRSLLAAFLLVVPVQVLAADPAPRCPGTVAFARSVDAAGKADAAPGDRDKLVPALAACLAHPDPTVRDGLAYTTLAGWLRAEAISPPVRAGLMRDLLAVLAPDYPDPHGFHAPFAALMLAEIARTDRVAPWLDGGGRDALVAAATGYLAGVRDYRGFTDGQGWRHGVAHGADFVMQLVLNPALDAGSRRRLLDAVAAQVAPVAAPPYVHTESERLARPVLLALAAETFDEAGWASWLEALASPAPMASWGEAWQDEAALARRHNLRAFLFVLHAGASSDERLSAYVPAVQAALRASQ
ncbi:DUF2785 domain-containing protein [Arenimonas sp.]|uniref:DUF2785 domain-containing protein n=1 Tax=Arenimonas sp. TaxID=1872635 RepID=UPI0035B352F6